jgi:hypothetical protein
MNGSALARTVGLAFSAMALMTLAIQPAASAGSAGHAANEPQRSPRTTESIPGAQLWVSRYNGPKNKDEFANATAVSPDGTEVFVTGNSYGGSTGSDDYATVAYDASTGAQLWVSRYNGAGDGYDAATALGVSPDGSMVFVTGSSYGSTTTNDYATVAYEAATGTPLWVSRYNGPPNGDDISTALGVSPDGSTVFVTGYSDGGSTSGYDYATVAYDVSTGTRLWVSRYLGPANGVDVSTALGVSPDGSTVFVTGESTGSTSRYDYATVAYGAATGAKLWVRRYNGPGNGDDGAYALEVSPDAATVFATGYSTGSTSGYDYSTVAYTAATGTKQWVSRYNGPGSSDDAAYALEVSPDGSTVFATGYSAGSTTGYDYATMAYDAANGAQLWLSRYNGPANGDDLARALGVSPDGSTVLVTGSSYGSTTGYDYATAAHDASTGAQLWASRYNGPGNGSDSASALGVSPDGSAVLVAGTSWGSGTHRDYATVAYALS